MSAVTRARPEILTVGSGLDRPVRWVHASDRPDIARLLEGGELLLSTGAAWPEHPDDLGEFARRLARLDVAAVILELGSTFTSPPRGLVAACEEVGLPLIALRSEAKFVTITQAVHERILQDQAAALVAQERVRAVFTELGLQGAPPDFITRTAAELSGGAVVLENVAHEVIAAHGPGLDPGPLADWRRASALARRDAEWLVVPVQASTRRWGALIAPPTDGAVGERRAVLEQAALALAVARLSSPDDDWTAAARRRLVNALLDGRYTGPDALAARLEAAGFPVTGRRIVAAAASGSGLGRAVDASGDAATSTELVAIDRPHGLLLLVAGRAGEEPDPQGALQRAGLATASGQVVLAIGPAADDLSEALASARSAEGLLGALSATPHGWTVGRTGDHPLRELVHALAGDERVDRLVADVLGPVLDRSDADSLLTALEATTRHPGNRSAAAAASGLSRSSFYQRLAVLEQLLGVRLDDGETLAAIHVAVLARRFAAGTTR